MKKSFSFSLFLLLSAVLFAAPKAPRWVTDRSGVYPYDKFISETGTGSSAENAKANALSRIAGYINVTVKTEKTARESSLMVSSSASKSETYERTQELLSVSNITSNAELFCVQYTDSYYNSKEKTYYCVAFIDRENAWSVYSPKIESAKNKFYNFYKKGKSLADDDPFSAISYYKSAAKEGETFTELCDFGRFISSKCTEVYGSVQDEVDSLDGLIAELFSELKLTLSVTGDFTNIISKKITDLFSEEGFTFAKNKNDAVYIVNVEIDLNEVISNKGTEDEVTAVYPAVNIYLENRLSGETVFSMEEEISDKTAAFNHDTAVKKGLKKLADKLDEKYRGNLICAK